MRRKRTKKDNAIHPIRQMTSTRTAFFIFSYLAIELAFYNVCFFEAARARSRRGVTEEKRNVDYKAVQKQRTPPQQASKAATRHKRTATLAIR